MVSNLGVYGIEGLGSIAPLKYIEYGVYGDLIIIYPKPFSIYLRGTTGFGANVCICGLSISWDEEIWKKGIT